jgi:hypothetical protein
MRLFYGILVLISAASLAWSQEPEEEHFSYSMERVRTRTSSNLPASLLSQLQSYGYGIFRTPEKRENDADKDNDKDADEKKLVSEIFWAKKIRTGADAANGVLYGNLKQGSLIGVIHFLIIQRYVRDYRSQMLRPGYYTMRYAIMPKGASENEPRDFVLLTPVSDDRHPDLIEPLPDLVHRSRLASPVHQPVAMSLVAIDTDEALPSLVTDEQGTSVLQVKLPSSAGGGKVGKEIPIALVVFTWIPEDLGD